MKIIVLSFMCFTYAVLAKSNTEKIGDFLAFAIPATAYGSTFYMDDIEGREQFYWAYGTTMISTVFLKYTVRAERPDNNDRDSFPSGHMSSAVSGASFIHKRYGLSYALPFYVAAIYTGYSRVHSNRHYTRDVVGGALLGALSSWYFVDEKRKLNITPEIGRKYQGLSVKYTF